MMILTRDKPRRGELVEKISGLNYQLFFLRWNWRMGFGLAIDFRRARSGFPLNKKVVAAGPNRPKWNKLGTLKD